MTFKDKVKYDNMFYFVLEAFKSRKKLSVVFDGTARIGLLSWENLISPD